MRVCVIDRGLGIERALAEVKALGGRDIKTLTRVGQIYADLDDPAVERLKTTPGLAVRPVSKITTAQYEALPAVYASSQAGLASMLYQFRASFEPPIVGRGFTCVVLDSGIRRTHMSLQGKVVYEANFTPAPTAEDVFDHGTSVAYMVCGGRHALGEEAGIAPAAWVMNLKVIDDKGEGTDETVTAGIDECIRLVEDARAKGLPLTDQMRPNAYNMSFGKPDTGDPEDPVRVAIDKLLEINPGPVFAAAGNEGPNPGTVTLPASHPGVWGIGAATFIPFDVWEKSSRGPTPEDVIKPDLVAYGVNVLLASAKADSTFILKTGTSFSSPLVAGGWGLIFEWGLRYLTPAQLEAVARMTKPEWEMLMALISVKAPQAPVEKDNTWGYGMPMGDLLLRQLVRPAPAIQDTLFGLAGLGLVGGIISAIAR